MAAQLILARRLVALALLASLFVGLVPAPASALTGAQIRNRVYEKVNTTRKNHGLRPLRVNDKTQHWAKDHSQWLGAKCPLSLPAWCHDSDLFGTVELPSGTTYFRENIAFNYVGRGVAKRIHRSLMESPGHRANILSANSTHMGFGVVKRSRDGSMRVWVTQRFITRR